MKNLGQSTGTRELFEKTAKIGRIGVYELNTISSEIYWSDITREITEVPSEFVPKLDNIEFFSGKVVAGTRPSKQCKMH